MATLTVYRRKLAQELGLFGIFTATGGSTTTLVCGNAFGSTELPTDALAYAWILVPSITASAARQRRVKKAGLDGTTATITVDGSFASAVANGTIFEVHCRLPGVRDAEATESISTMLGVHECINLALRHLLVVDDAQTISLVTAQRDYSLSSLTYLDRPERLLDVRQLDATGASYVSTWRTWEFRESAAGSVLHFPSPFRFASGSYSAKLVTLRPADTLISGASSSVGLIDEGDTAVPDVNSVVKGGKVFAYRALRDARKGPARAHYAGLYEEAVADFRKCRGYDHTNDVDPTVPGATPDAALMGAAA